MEGRSGGEPAIWLPVPGQIAKLHCKTGGQGRGRTAGLPLFSRAGPHQSTSSPRGGARRPSLATADQRLTVGASLKP